MTQPGPHQPDSREEPVLQLAGVAREFGSGASLTQALRTVNLTVHTGEFVAIVGPSGAGKSTLLNILGLLDPEYTGSYLLNGRNVGVMSETDRNQARSREIGFVFQASHMMLRSTTAENAALGLAIQGAPVAERVTKVQRALARLNMLPRSNVLAQNLSGGERQRAAISRAIATSPKLLLADEPTGALDTVNSQNIIDYLRELNRGGMTIVVITHDPLVAQAAQRQVKLIDGSLDDGRAFAELKETADWDLRELSVSTPAEAPLSEEQPNKRKWQRRQQRTRDSGRFWRRVLDEFTEAISSHTGRPARSLLLLFAFLLGSGGLVASMGISQSAAQQVTDRLTRASLDEVIVFPDKEIPLNSEAYSDLAENGIPARLRVLEGVLAVGVRATVVKGGARVSSVQPGTFQKESAFKGTVMIGDAGLLQVSDASVVPERASAYLSNGWGGAVAIVGEAAAKTLGLRMQPGSDALDQTSLGYLWVNNRRVDVVGYIQNPGRDPRLANGIVLSRAAGTDLTTNEVSLVVRTWPGYPAPIAEAAPLAVDPAQPTLTKVSTVADLRNLTRGVSTDLGTFVSVMSLILLLLASLSSATAMYLSVQSRASEIALRRAIGASRSAIWRMFTFEGLTIGIAGGVAGCAVGVIGLLLVCAAQGWVPVLDVSILGVGLIAGAVSGVVSAMYPALVAANAPPSEAIRG